MSNQKRPSDKDDGKEKAQTPPPHAPEPPPMSLAEAMKMVVLKRLSEDGWFFDYQWAVTLGQTIERFRETVRAEVLPHRKWGPTIAVHMDHFFEIERLMNGPQEKKKDVG
jgi:hypothetical protein